MNTRKPRDPPWIAGVCRLYAAALHLYPRRYRERWGAPMQQAFRDRCREAARGGRGRWQVLFLELLPDLATSVGRERVDSIAEFSSRQRLLLVTLMFALGGALIFHAQLGDAVVAAHDSWKQYQLRLDARALDQHEAALAAMVETRGGPHADVIAAQLFWAAGRGFARNYPEASGPTLDKSEVAASDALLDRADAAFTRALRGNDRWALWLATTSCPARSAVCGKDAAFDRLRQLDSGNGAVWLEELYRASRVGDESREREALAQLARASSFDWHFADSVKGMIGAFALRRLPARLSQSYTDGEKATADDSALLLAGNIGASYGTLQAPAFDPLERYCRSPAAGMDASRVADCRAAGRLMVEHGTGILDVAIGYHLWLLAANQDEHPLVLQGARDIHWRMHQYANVVPQISASATRRWRAAWLGSASEMQVLDRLLQEQGASLTAPKDFRDRLEP